MNAYNRDILSLIEELGSNAANGLSEGQVQEKLRRHGENRLREKKRKTNLQRFAEQFKDAMILILLAAAAVSFVIACIEKDPTEFFEPVLILLIVILNAGMGVMQESKSEGETQTPLQKKLAQLGKYLGVLALAACAIIFAVGIVNEMPVLDIFMTAVSLAVSAIPEGLPAIVTIVLSIGVQRMVKKNAIIRSLPAVETLGSASIICSDKTGTLTQNRMTLGGKPKQ